VPMLTRHSKSQYDILQAWPVYSKRRAVAALADYIELVIVMRNAQVPYNTSTSTTPRREKQW
jgi:hypothetical protein